MAASKKTPTPDELRSTGLLWSASLREACSQIRWDGMVLAAEDDRRELLKAVRAGEVVELEFDIVAFRQREGEHNRNHVRFAKKLLPSLGKSFAGAPFIRDHDQRNSLARGGTVRAAKAVKVEGGWDFVMTVAASKPWAVEGVLDGTIDRFSIGWATPGWHTVMCSLCEEPFYRGCWHFPGDRVDVDGEMQTVEWVYTEADGIEVSSVVVPAVLGTEISDIRGLFAALSADTPPPCSGKAEEAMPPKSEDTAAENEVQPQNDEALSKARTEAATAERQRIGAIRRVAEKLGVGAELLQQHIDAGTPVDEFRALAIDAFELAKEPIVSDAGRAKVTAGEDARDKWLLGAGDWLIERAAVVPIVEEASRKNGAPRRVDAGEFRGLSLLDLARESLERSGVKTRGMDKMRLVGAAFTQLGAGGYHTTSDFAVLLENTLHKVLLAQYAITPDTWSRFCAVGSVSDFRAHNRYRMGTFGSLDTVAEHGEFTSKTIPDARKESITAATKGNIIALSRQAIINDDMSAFSRLATMFGRAARLSIEVDVYALLQLNAGLGPSMGDGKTLFHADHNNIGTGATLSVASIDADRVKLASQTDESGNEILDLRPAILVIPIGLGGDARVLNDAQYDVDGIDPGTDESNKFMRPNKVRGLYRDIVDTPRLPGTRRYSFADPSIAPTIEVAFLDGQQAPFMEMQDGWRVDGVEWKVRLDYAAGAIDYRGAVTNAGQ